MQRLTCEETFRRLDDFLDRELDPEETRLVEEHLAVCDVCLKEFVFERRVIDDVRGKLRRVSIPPELRARISERLRAAGEGPAQ